MKEWNKRANKWEQIKNATELVAMTFTHFSSESSYSGAK